MNGSIECAFVGRVGTKPEIQESLGCAGPSLAFGVAVGRQWVHVAVFGEEAERVAASLQFGDEVYVDGRLTLKSYDRNGEARHVLSVSALRCDRIRLIGRARPMPIEEDDLPMTAGIPLVAIEGARDDQHPEDSPPCPS
jgi:single-stranded DNA-binding protein